MSKDKPKPSVVDNTRAMTQEERRSFESRLVDVYNETMGRQNYPTGEDAITKLIFVSTPKPHNDNLFLSMLDEGRKPE
jgi:hypothetical protein